MLSFLIPTIFLFLFLAYPDQTGIKPIHLHWGAPTPELRGPILVSRQPGSIKLRNAIGAHSGSYSIYRALAIAIGTLDPSHKPDYSLTEPPVPIPFQESWADPKKIVSFDPWGHVVAQVFKDQLDAGMDARPSIAITKAVSENQLTKGSANAYAAHQNVGN